MNTRSKIILASKSARRLKLLSQIIRPEDIVVFESGIAETALPGENACAYTKRMAEQKVRNVLDKYPGRIDHNCIVIGADTVVVLDNKIIGKPENKTDALGILQKLSGRWHEVVTGVAVYSIARRTMKSFTERSRVKMRRITKNKIMHYIDTNEPMDKAGAYAIQGQGRGLIVRYEGSFSNIVGLPIKPLKAVLGETIS